VRRQVGAVIVRDRHVLATGFNSPPRGAPHRTEETCVRIGIPSGTQTEKVCCAHAESNSIALAAYHGVSIAQATMYVSIAPCSWCARTIVNAGIVRVVYAEGYPDPLAAQVYAESTVRMEQLPKPEDIDRYGRLRPSDTNSTAADDRTYAIAAPVVTQPIVEGPPQTPTPAGLMCVGPGCSHDWIAWTSVFIHGAGQYVRRRA
jgi:dCMP deaminase